MMILLIANIFLLPLIIFLFFSFVYYAVFVIVYFFNKKSRIDSIEDIIPSNYKPKFIIVIPAHNEELIIEKLCINLKSIEYDLNDYDIMFVADNCVDNTASICLENGYSVIERSDKIYKGKGYAINYAISKIDLNSYDAVLIIDADTLVDKKILHNLSKYLFKNEKAIQCYIEIPNRFESWFTKLLYVARVINGKLYHSPKFECGLSSYLMGTGICFSTSLLKDKGWTAFSIAEDWEYYAQLLLEGYRVAFAKDAIVYQFESKTLHQATSQRLRWSSGRWKVTKSLGLQLMAEGVKNKNLLLFDSSLPLLLPNYSLHINLTFIIVAVLFVLPISDFGTILLLIGLIILFGQFLIFFVGSLISGYFMTTFKAALCVPFFLVWKGVIDLLCITGFYKGKDWVRTERHLSKKQ